MNTIEFESSTCEEWVPVLSTLPTLQKILEKEFGNKLVEIQKAALNGDEDEVYFETVDELFYEGETIVSFEFDGDGPGGGGGLSINKMDNAYFFRNDDGQKLIICEVKDIHDLITLVPDPGGHFTLETKYMNENDVLKKLSSEVFFIQDDKSVLLNGKQYNFVFNDNQFNLKE